MSCACQTGCRQLLVFAPRLAQRYPELAEFQPGQSWDVLAEVDAVRVDIGPGQPWQSLRELVNFLRSVIDEPRLEQVSATWIAHCSSCSSAADQLPAKVNAQPLTTMAPLDPGPLHELLKHQRIETWFQPVVTSQPHRIWGYECLMRGRDAQGELIPPNKIFDWARQEQLTFMLDRMCRETHLHNAGRANIPEDAHLLINFLPTTVYDPRFCLQTTVQSAHKAQIDPSRIVFEVVESEQINDHEHLLSILGFYREAGFSVALDDVGAGYSGLMMLAEMNPDLVKIDRGLVTRAPDSNLHQGICRSLVELAHEANKLCLAEGVETKAQYRLMEDLGVDLHQGYLFGKPTPKPMQPEELAAQAA